MSGSWLEELEARLERQLESFLRGNPHQEQLLAEQEARDRQQELLQARHALRQEAERQRRALLDLAGEIHRWQARVGRARGAGAEDLATRAEAHVGVLMDRGRQRWQLLAELGERDGQLQRQLDRLVEGRPAAEPADDLEAAWADFEARQELQELQQRLQR